MSENVIVDYMNNALQYKKTITFGLGLIGIFVLDVTIGPLLPFWMTPLTLGIIAGIIAVSARYGLLAGLGAMVGRFLSILVMVMTVPGFLATLDLFMDVIGSFIGTGSLPAGALIVILLSVIFCGLFTILGGAMGGSIARIVQIFLVQEEETGEPGTISE